MDFKGKAWKFGSDVDTDAIMPARYLNTFDPAELAKHCMEDVAPDFSAQVKPGDIMVAGKNFGCGSSREHAPIAIKAAGISCVIAGTFARIFYRNAFNIGLPIFESPEAVQAIRQDDKVAVDANTGIITNYTTGQTYQAAPIPTFMLQIIRGGGLIPYVAERLKTK